MDLLLQMTYSLTSQSVMSDAASDPTGVSAPISVLLLLPVCVPLAALSSGCKESNHYLQHTAPRPRVGAPGPRGVVAGMAHSCFPRARGFRCTPDAIWLHPQQRAVATGTVCHALGEVSHPQ